MGSQKEPSITEIRQLGHLLNFSITSTKMTSNHNEDLNQASLAELVLSDQLTPDEYFSIALSSSADVSSAQTAISRVLTRIQNDQKKRILQELYHQIFKQPEMPSPSNDSCLGLSDKSSETAK